MLLVFACVLAAVMTSAQLPASSRLSHHGKTCLSLMMEPPIPYNRCGAQGQSTIAQYMVVPWSMLFRPWGCCPLRCLLASSSAHH